jgi:hypothetical protein
VLGVVQPFGVPAQRSCGTATNAMGMATLSTMFEAALPQRVFFARRLSVHSGPGRRRERENSLVAT